LYHPFVLLVPYRRPIFASFRTGQAKVCALTDWFLHMKLISRALLARRLMAEAAGSCKMTVNFYQKAGRYNVEDSRLLTCL
jgi:hypothetical protein